ncbi:acyl-CoA thioesterase [Salinimonas sediminis]|uniref:Acyl-CoA thioesterase n=1 Tax=Salinimonas sediminis TaxID=2303538 RepID=A0A346NHD0_9ALTE|nr:thioesterase family protein [Salinimonas sediminis]AXR04937.1 acyl-CoA thioesterase [Salinimonas sediminis]
MTDFSPSLADYPYQVTLLSQPQDCDEHGNLNNVVFYRFFDTAVKQFMVQECQLNPLSDIIVPFISSTQCQYICSATYPETMVIGMRVIKMGRSAVTYGLSAYAGEQHRRVAHGQFVQVFVKRSSQRAVTIPDTYKALLKPLMESFE